jgi:hypothetical protein
MTDGRSLMTARDHRIRPVTSALPARLPVQPSFGNFSVNHLSVAAHQKLKSLARHLSSTVGPGINAVTPIALSYFAAQGVSSILTSCTYAVFQPVPGGYHR